MKSDKSKQRPFVLHTRVVTGTGGGPEKTILNSPRFLQPYGIDSACLFMRPPEDRGFASLEAKAAAADAPIIGVDDRGPLDRSVLTECIRICKERNVDIWHGHDYKSNALGLWVRRHHPMHLVTTAHGWVRFTAKTPLYYCIDRFCMKRHDRVICVSQDLQQRCLGLGIRDDRLSLIDNAIVAEDYDPSPPTLAERRRFGFDDQHILLGAAGRLSEEKGFAHLISAVYRLVRSGHPVGLLIAGEGHLKETLEQQIRDLQLENHVRLTGFLKDPRELYRAIDVFVLSSLREGLPNVVLEAMASGRAVVTTNVNGIPRLVESGRNGIVVNADSVDHLFHGIRDVLESDHERQQIAQSGRETVETRFSFQRRMEHIVSIYRGLSRDLANRIAERPVSSHQLQTV
ncbi:MAG: glycosyltransferase family 4 protein [Planctomycetaceae bacterium]|nr:glycosyltransferase family 4 protein [Planctomycetaceae bacterium]